MTAKVNARPALGRGLSALISARPVPVAAETQDKVVEVKIEGDAKEFQGVKAQYVDITSVSPDPNQPRRTFGEAELLELADSIKKLGVIQPILARRISSEVGGSLQIVAGERRWRAARLAGLSQVPVIIRDFDERGALEVAIVENVQRENLNPVEEAQAYERLMQEFALSQEEVGVRVGKDRASVANLLRLLKLPNEVLDALKSGDISSGHAKAILSIREPSAQIGLARKVIKEGLSVRSLEAIVSRMVVLDAGKRSTLSASTPRIKADPNPGFDETLERLRRGLGTKVHIRHQRSGKGKIEIEYFSEQELDRLVALICD